MLQRCSTQPTFEMRVLSVIGDASLPRRGGALPIYGRCGGVPHSASARFLGTARVTIKAICFLYSSICVSSCAMRAYPLPIALLSP